MANQSPIFSKTEAFMVWLLDHTGKFNKNERFRLAKRIDDAMFDFHACITAAVYGNNTREALRRADLHLNLLRSYLRISLELKYTKPSQFKHASEKIAELGRLLGGWSKKT